MGKLTYVTTTRAVRIIVLFLMFEKIQLFLTRSSILSLKGAFIACLTTLKAEEDIFTMFWNFFVIVQLIFCQFLFVYAAILCTCCGTCPCCNFKPATKDCKRYVLKLQLEFKTSINC